MTTDYDTFPVDPEPAAEPAPPAQEDTPAAPVEDSPAPAADPAPEPAHEEDKGPTPLERLKALEDAVWRILHPVQSS